MGAFVKGDVVVAPFPFTVRARRLDGDAPSFQVSEATNGYHKSFSWAMLIGVSHPTAFAGGLRKP